MAKRYIITLTSANRVGILAAITNAMAELGGDLHEVSLSALREYFAIIIDAEFPPHRDPEVIADHLRDVGRGYGVDVCVKDPADETVAAESSSDFQRYFLTVTGQNRPGIMQQLSARLAQDNVDISDLYATRSQGRLFVIAMELAVPRDTDPVALGNDLEQMGSDAGWSAVVESADDFPIAAHPRPVRAALRDSEMGL